MPEYADADVAAIDKKKAAKGFELAKARRQEIDSTRAAVKAEKARPAKPRKAPSAKDLEGLAPREPDPEPAPLPDLDVSSGESEGMMALATAAQALEEAGMKAVWRAKNDKTLGSSDRQLYKQKADAYREAAQIVREVELGES